MAGILGTRQNMVKGAYSAEPVDFQHRYFIVTGCTTGSLGFATALQLLAQDAVVSVTVRNNSEAYAAALREHWLLAPIKIFTLLMWLCRSSARHEATSLRLDVLINYVGIHLDLMSRWTGPLLSTDGIEIQWRVNYLGTAHLTYRLQPLLKTSAAISGDGRVVNVASQLHGKGLNTEFFYAAVAQ